MPPRLIQELIDPLQVGKYFFAHFLAGEVVHHVMSGQPACHVPWGRLLLASRRKWWTGGQRHAEAPEKPIRPRVDVRRSSRFHPGSTSYKDFL